MLELLIGTLRIRVCAALILGRKRTAHVGGLGVDPGRTAMFHVLTLSWNRDLRRQRSRDAGTQRSAAKWADSEQLSVACSCMGCPRELSMDDKRLDLLSVIDAATMQGILRTVACTFHSLRLLCGRDW